MILTKLTINFVFVFYLHFFPIVVGFGREIDHLLDFIAGSVRVLSEDYAMPFRRRRQSHESITGGRLHPAPQKQIIETHLVQHGADPEFQGHLELCP